METWHWIFVKILVRECSESKVSEYLGMEKEKKGEYQRILITVGNQVHV